MPIAPPKLLLEPPQTLQMKVRYGLLDAATVIDVPEDAGNLHGWANGLVWEPEPCEPPRGFDFTCPRPAIPPVKIFDYGGPGRAEAMPFTLYASSQCSAPGHPNDWHRKRARKRLELHESWGVERMVSGQFGLSNTPTIASLTAVDLTPAAGALTVLGGVTALEDHLARTAGGYGMLHVARALVPSLCNGNLAHRDGETLRTCLDTPIAAGAGYDFLGPDGSIPPPGEAWMYVTGPPIIYRGPIVDVISEGNEWMGFNHSNNDLLGLTERDYVFTFSPCSHAAVRVTIGCCC